MVVFIRIILGVICLLSLGATTVYAQTGHPFADNSDFDVCTQSLMRSLDAWDTNLGTIDYRREANNRGFSIKDCANIIKSQKATTASNSDSQSNATGRNTVGSQSGTTSNITHSNQYELCKKALNASKSDWSQFGSDASAVEEAKSVNYTIVGCSNIVSAEDQKSEPSVFATAHSKTISRDVNFSITKACGQSPTVPEFGPFSATWRGQLINGHYEYLKEFQNKDVKRGQSLKQTEKDILDIKDQNKLKLHEYSIIESYGPLDKTYSTKLTLEQKTVRFNRDDDRRVCYIEIQFDDPPYTNSPIDKEEQNLFSISASRRYASDSNRLVCARALNRAYDDWETDTPYDDNVKEAKFRNLTVADCQREIGEDLTNTNQNKSSASGKLIIVGWRRKAQLLDGSSNSIDREWRFLKKTDFNYQKKLDHLNIDTGNVDLSELAFVPNKLTETGKKSKEVLEIIPDGFVDHLFDNGSETYKLTVKINGDKCTAVWDMMDLASIGVSKLFLGPISCDVKNSNEYVPISHDHIGPDQLKIDAESELQALKDQIAKTKSDEAQANKDQLIQVDKFVVASRSKLEALNIRVRGYQELQTTVKSDYESKLQISIKQITGHISELSAAKVTVNNADQINELQRQLADLKSRSLAHDQLYQSVSSKLSAVTKEISQAQSDLKSSLDANIQILDAQRKADMDDITSKLASLSLEINTSQEKIDADIAEFKTKTSAQFSQIASSIDDLNARTAQLEKDQKELAKKQADLAQQQSNTDKRLTATNQLLANILLPVTERADDWMMRVAAVPVQQQQFCRIVDRFYDDLAAVYKVRNDIKKNALYKDRQQDLAALLPAGAINSWIVRVVEVTQAADGSAAVMLQPPCRAMLGSDACSTDQKKFRATIAPETLMYRELARLNSGDFVTISGTILYAQTSASTSPLPQYALYEPNKHCSAADGAKQEDVFVTELTNLAALR